MPVFYYYYYYYIVSDWTPVLTAELSNVAESVRVNARFSPVLRSSTAGQMAVGGSMCSLNGPKSHSGFTWDAQRLCSWKDNVFLLCLMTFQQHSGNKLLITFLNLMASTDVIFANNCNIINNQNFPMKEYIF